MEDLSDKKKIKILIYCCFNEFDYLGDLGYIKYVSKIKEFIDLQDLYDIHISKSIIKIRHPLIIIDNSMIKHIKLIEYINDLYY